MRPRYSPITPEIERQIDALVQTQGDSPDRDLVREMIVTALRLARDGADRGSLKILNSAFKELRYAFKVFAGYRNVRKVSIFGSARIKPDHAAYAMARDFGERVAKAGFMVITGAGGGIMEAGHAGAGPELSFGVNIRLPFEQQANPIIQDDPKLINFKYFFSRKLVFVKEADAIALFPGGVGTMDEAFEGITLMQTGKSPVVPIVLVDTPDGAYWRRWDAFLRECLLAQKLVAADDLGLYRIHTSVESALEEIRSFYRNYHSQRYVGGDLVLRLRHAPTDAQIAELRSDFKDILAPDSLRVSAALPEEDTEPALADLPRLVADFDRTHFSRLRALIDRLNAFAPLDPDPLAPSRK